MIDSAKWTGRTEVVTTLTFFGSRGYEKGDLITVLGCANAGLFRVNDVQTFALTVEPCPWYLKVWWRILQLLYVHKQENKS